jgi:hypothetical protein
MAVAAGLDVDPAGRRRIEIEGVNRGRAAKERERRLEHPPVADEDQALEPAFVRFLDQHDDVALLAVPDDDLRVRDPRALTPKRLARPLALLSSAELHFGHVLPILRCSCDDRSTLNRKAHATIGASRKSNLVVSARAGP